VSVESQIECTESQSIRNVLDMRFTCYVPLTVEHLQPAGARSRELSFLLSVLKALDEIRARAFFRAVLSVLFIASEGLGRH
jgi:hypothetical protein